MTKYHQFVSVSSNWSFEIQKKQYINLWLMLFFIHLKRCNLHQVLEDLGAWLATKFICNCLPSNSNCGNLKEVIHLSSGNFDKELEFIYLLNDNFNNELERALLFNYPRIFQPLIQGFSTWHVRNLVYFLYLRCWTDNNLVVSYCRASYILNPYHYM